MALPTYSTTAAMRLPGLVEALLGHLTLGFRLQLRIEFLYQPIEAFALQKVSLKRAMFSEFSRVSELVTFLEPTFKKRDKHQIGA